jgi:hypothetical protein
MYVFMWGVSSRPPWGNSLQDGRSVTSNSGLEKPTPTQRYKRISVATDHQPLSRTTPLSTTTTTVLDLI